MLTPLAVDPGHPFPYISDLSLNLAVDRARPDTGRAPLRPGQGAEPAAPLRGACPTASASSRSSRSSPPHLDALFPGMEIGPHHTFRVTRNADLTLEEEDADDLLAAVEIELRRRRFGRAVRLEIDARDVRRDPRAARSASSTSSDDDVYTTVGPLDLGGLWSVHGARPPRSQGPGLGAHHRARLASRDDEQVNFFNVLRRATCCVHHPYTSFATSVEEFIRQASLDPKVLAIKLTLYRTSGDSSIIQSLIRAAERGKQVAALVELKARFDEENNIEWARELEKAGVHVVYGLVGLKIHTKTTLVVREEPDGIRRYCHVGTGNYNPKTARLYEDLGLLTCDPEIGVRPHAALQLPHRLRPRAAVHEAARRARDLRTGIARPHRATRPRTARDGRIIVQDEQPGRPRADRRALRGVAGRRADRPHRPRHLLPAAGRAGAVREHPRALDRRSLPRALAHLPLRARRRRRASPSYYIGSADLMPRNLDRRVEALVPVEAPALQRAARRDPRRQPGRRHAWPGRSARRHVAPRRRHGGTIETHRRLQELALDRRTPS